MITKMTKLFYEGRAWMLFAVLGGIAGILITKSCLAQEKDKIAGWFDIHFPSSYEINLEHDIQNRKDFDSLHRVFEYQEFQKLFQDGKIDFEEIPEPPTLDDFNVLFRKMGSIYQIFLELYTVSQE